MGKTQEKPSILLKGHECTKKLQQRPRPRPRLSGCVKRGDHNQGCHMFKLKDALLKVKNGRRQQVVFRKLKFRQVDQQMKTKYGG